MIIEKDKIMGIVIESINEITDEWEIKCDYPILAETRIWGGESSLTSMNIVNIIVCIEEKIADAYNLQITIADEKAFSQSKSPFKSVESLTNYIVGLISETQ